MVADKWLLDTARDHFHFVTKFFEVINLSATHIYHSALELSPKLSIIRKHYHQWVLQGSKPRVVCGIPNSWDQLAAISGDYESCTWSPCGQFFSAQTRTSVEVWDALTLEKSSTLQPTNLCATGAWHRDYSSSDALAYSSDGHSLAACFGSAITIWDIQTGGVVKEIEGGATNHSLHSLVWSLDGTTICAIFPTEELTWAVVKWEVASGKEASIGEFRSLAKPFLWSNNDTLRVMVMLGNGGNNDDERSRVTADILEVWPIPIDDPVESFPIGVNPDGPSISFSFSPSARRISVTDSLCREGTLFAFDIRNSKVLFRGRGYFSQSHLSPDGSLLAACQPDAVCTWKYTSEQGYVPWRKFPSWHTRDLAPRYCRLSTTSSSILISCNDFLEIRHLEDPQTNPPPQPDNSYDQFSTDGAYVVTVPRGGRTIAITNLHKHLSWSIDTELDIQGLALTNNVLLVGGDGMVVGWRLTAEGMVDKVLNDGRKGDHDDRLWTKALPRHHARIWVRDHIGVIAASEDLFDIGDPTPSDPAGKPLMYYDTETGEELESVSVEAPPPSSPSWDHLCNRTLDFGAQRSFSRHDFVHLEDDQDPPVSMPWYKEGWVKYPEGEHWHRFWLPVHWRSDWRGAHWIDDATTLRLVTAGSGPVIIKF